MKWKYACYKEWVICSDIYVMVNVPGKENIDGKEPPCNILLWFDEKETLHNIEMEQFGHQLALK
jgi:hypothetical protein